MTHGTNQLTDSSSDHGTNASVTDEIARLNREARAASQAGRLDAATALWRQALATDPDNSEALEGLQRCASDFNAQAVRRKIGELRGKADSEQISELDEALRLARELSANDLDDNLRQKVEEYEKKARDKRRTLKKEAGEIETLGALGRLKTAIHQLEGYIKMGRYEFEDRDGCIVPAAQILARLNHEYQAFCTEKAHEYLERAEQHLPAHPNAARNLISDALSEFDRADPATTDRMKHRLIEIDELVNRWERAQELIRSGIAKSDPEQRLNNFLYARSIYPHTEEIERLIEDASCDVAAASVHHIRNIHDQALLLLTQGRFDEALQATAQGRERAGRVRGAFEGLDAELHGLDSLVSEILKAQSNYREQQGALQRRLDAADAALCQGDLDQAESIIAEVLSASGAATETREAALRLQAILACKRRIRALQKEFEDAVQNGDLARAQVIISMLLVSCESEDAELAAMREQLAQATQRQRVSDIEADAKMLLEKADDQLKRRLFTTAQETIDRVATVGKELPAERRESLDVDVAVLWGEIKEAQTVWSSYTQARIHAFEGQGALQVDNRGEAVRLLERVMQHPPRGDVVKSIQNEARTLYNGLMLGASLLQGDLEEVEKRLVSMLAMDPHDIGILTSLHRVQATKYLRSFADQADATRQMARKEAQGWYRASIISAVIFSGLFIYAVLNVLLTQPNNTLEYLTPLYTFIPGILSAVFFKQYNDANQRLDKEQQKLRERVEDFEQKQFAQMSTVSGQSTELVPQVPAEKPTAS